MKTFRMCWGLLLSVVMAAGCAAPSGDEGEDTSGSAVTTAEAEGAELGDDARARFFTDLEGSWTNYGIGFNAPEHTIHWMTVDAEAETVTWSVTQRNSEGKFERFVPTRVGKVTSTQVGSDLVFVVHDSSAQSQAILRVTYAESRARRAIAGIKVRDLVGWSLSPAEDAFDNALRWDLPGF